MKLLMRDRRRGIGPLLFNYLKNVVAVVVLKKKTDLTVPLYIIFLAALPRE